MPEAYVFMRYGGAGAEAFADVDRSRRGRGEHTGGTIAVEVVR